MMKKKIRTVLKMDDAHGNIFEGNIFGGPIEIGGGSSRNEFRENRFVGYVKNHPVLTIISIAVTIIGIIVNFVV